MTTVTRKKIPEQCPVHPNSGGVVSKTTSSTDCGITLDHRITQHLCAEPGCREPLGWEYHGPKGAFQWGPGRPSPDLELFVAQSQHDKETASTMGGVAFFGIASYILIWVGLFWLTGNAWGVFHSVTVSLYYPALVWAIVALDRKLNRKRPRAEEAWARPEESGR